jgi:hypothetical protein
MTEPNIMLSNLVRNMKYQLDLDDSQLEYVQECLVFAYKEGQLSELKKMAGEF